MGSSFEAESVLVLEHAGSTPGQILISLDSSLVPGHVCNLRPHYRIYGPLFGKVGTLPVYSGVISANGATNK